MKLIKQGDKVLCIKNYQDIKAGEYVIVVHIDIVSGGGGKLYSISRDGLNSKFGTAIYDEWFSEYFLTPLQERKMKLKKIKDDL